MTRFLCALFFLLPALLLAEDKISARNSTVGWHFPYKASAERSAKIAEGEKLLKAPVPYKDVIKLLGEPDTVTDLRGHFFGLSHSEDGFLVSNRRRLTWRAVWYLEKVDSAENVNNRWIAVYLGRNGTTVVKILRESI